MLFVLGCSGEASMYIYKQNEEQKMELINEIVKARKFRKAWLSTWHNHGAVGINKISVEELDVYMPLI